jgi:hypothetical protein
VRPHLIRLAHLLVLSAFAVAQPLLDILSKHAEFFAVRGSTPFDIVVFALAVTFVPALALFAVELAVFALDARAGTALHLVFVGGLAALFGIQVLERLGLDGTVVLIAAAVVLGLAAAFAVWRVSAIRSFLTILSPAPLVFLLVFLFGSPVENLVFPKDVEVSTAAVRTSTPVVLLVLDELPVISLMNARGEIDAERYPNFARLAGDSTWFRNTSTLSGSTTQAVPAVFTGRRPRRGLLPVFQNHPQNLFTLLGGRYRLHVQESQTRLCPGELCGRDRPPATERLSSLYSDARTVYAHLVAPPALAERLPAIDETWGDFGGETATDLEARTTLPKIDRRTFYIGRIREFRSFLAGIGPDEGAPTLHVLHTLLPHGPWLYFPDGRVSAVEQARAPGREGELWLDDGLALQAYQRHLLQLGYTDRLLGQVVGKLKRAGIYDRALVVVMADHGISFRGGDLRRRPSRTNLAELAFVPFFVKRPGGEGAGRVVDRHVQVIDVVPTIADVLDVEVPWKVDGVSAFATGPGSGQGKVVVSRLGSDLESSLEQREQALERQISLFGVGTWGRDLYGIGPYGELVGRDVGSFRLAEPADGEAKVDAVGTRLLRNLPERSPLVPSPLAGTLSGVEPGDELLFALNGEIGAVARAYRGADGVARFSALFPDSMFEGGANELRVFVASGSGRAPELQELQTSIEGQ